MGITTNRSETSLAKKTPVATLSTDLEKK